MQQIAEWLKGLGMSEYAERFAENKIDISVLPDLTDQHLKDLGVALGDRLKMLRAIRDLSGAAVAVTASSAGGAPSLTRRSALIAYLSAEFGGRIVSWPLCRLTRLSCPRDPASV